MNDEYIIKVQWTDHPTWDNETHWMQVKFTDCSDTFPLRHRYLCHPIFDDEMWMGWSGNFNTSCNMTVTMPDDPELFLALI